MTSLPIEKQNGKVEESPIRSIRPRLRLSQDFGASVGVKKAIVAVPCRKPHRHEFVRVRPGDEWRLETGSF